jgi:hypothetical protein
MKKKKTTLMEGENRGYGYKAKLVFESPVN